ncbi:MAG: hypothetical protein BWX80_01052 [Candidatus Hydrogenedentes bacterium ADurb.Bin101]|nr:MAG: hypothetical protein BWX80_01052 [Candidatus Hydrogenedentes bacterium ADurb.Bin101]
MAALFAEKQERLPSRGLQGFRQPHDAFGRHYVILATGRYAHGHGEPFGKEDGASFPVFVGNLVLAATERFADGLLKPVIRHQVRRAVHGRRAVD